MSARAFWVLCLGLGLLHTSCTDDDDAPNGNGGSVSTAGASAGASTLSAGAGAAEAAGGVSAEAGASGLAGRSGHGGRAGSVGGADSGGESGEGGAWQRTDCVGAQEKDSCGMSLNAAQNLCIDGDRACVCDSLGPELWNSGWKCFPIGCPTSQPHGGCTNVDPTEYELACRYDQTVCVCRGGLGMVNGWDCFVPLACPPSAPTVGEPCTRVTVPAPYDRCQYGKKECVCYSNGAPEPTWHCNDQ